MYLESPLERIKQVNADGIEFWPARDLMPVLEYKRWQRFSAPLQDVYSSLCLENPLQTEMIVSSRMVEIGYGAVREIEDWKLSRLAVERLLMRIASHKP